MASIAIKNQVNLAGAAKRFGKNSGKYLAAGLVGSSGLAAYFYSKNQNSNSNGGNNAKKLIAGSAIVNAAKVPEGKGKKDYQEVYNAIAQKIQDHLEYDGNAGFYGQLCRLSWHTSGTYDKSDNSGGSYSGSMIYAPEMYDPENNGLSAGRDFLTEFLVKYPWLSRGDLWTLGGVTAVQEAGGPKIPWRPGRFDTNDKSTVPEAGRLPDASKEDPQYVKGVFGRMGFNDQETVALLGAHCLGKCHVYNSGFDGPWTPAFNQFTNDFYVQLLEGWHIKDWDGNRQYEDDNTKSIMMLPTDMVLKTSDLFVKYVKQYAKDQDLFFADFTKAYSKLLELGVDFPEDQKPFIFDTLDEQDEDE